jgi:undecaprenyl-diphosphatase
MDSVETFNLWLFFFINNDLKSPLGDVLLGYTTYLGDGWILFPVSLFCLVWFGRHDWKQFRWHLAVIVVAAALGGICVQSLKSFFQSPRPLSFFEGAIQNGSVMVNVMFDKLYSRSFPSGHSQTALTFATFFAWVIGLQRTWSPRQITAAQTMCFVLAVVTSLSRVYVGAHFPRDIVAGAALGVALTKLTILIFSRWIPQKTMMTKM